MLTLSMLFILMPKSSGWLTAMVLVMILVIWISGLMVVNINLNAFAKKMLKEI